MVILGSGEYKYELIRPGLIFQSIGFWENVQIVQSTQKARFIFSAEVNIH